MAAEERATTAVVAAHNEADRIGATIGALRAAVPGIRVWVADDASSDGTADVVLGSGAQLVRRGRPHGKGANVTAAAEAALGDPAAAGAVFLLCDGDLGESAGELAKLVAAVRDGACDLAIATFRLRVGGGFGIVVRFSRWAIARRCGFAARAPISGQRAMRADALRALLPFAAGYGMETGMTIDAARAGMRIAEVELDLEHRATGRNLGGFLHRGVQLRDFLRVYVSRMGGRRRG
jgi:glycosyltransferase involved in cell wall biosynthesis